MPEATGTAAAPAASCRKSLRRTCMSILPNAPSFLFQCASTRRSRAMQDGALALLLQWEQTLSQTGRVCGSSDAENLLHVRPALRAKGREIVGQIRRTPVAQLRFVGRACLDAL